MAEFTAKCPHCSAELVAEEDWIGMEVECPTCSRSFILAKEPPRVPKLTLPPIKPVTPAASADEGDEEKSFIFVCPECGTQVELPIVLKGKKYECKACCEESIAEPATEKKCPHCGQTIKFHATICKFCKKNVENSANASVNLQPISPIGNRPLNLQPINPIQNHAGVTLQPINPVQNQPGVTLQPINPIQNQMGAPLQPINPIPNAPYNPAPATGELIYLSPAKNKALAIVLNVLVCGIGHVYIGQVAKGLTLFGAMMGIVIIARCFGIPVLAIPFWLLYIFSIVDIVMLYKKLEKGYGIKQWDFFFSK